MDPVVIIKNNGSTNLTSLKITYGITGTTPSVYQWTGNLSFAETEEIQLDTFQWAYAPATFPFRSVTQTVELMSMLTITA